MNVSRKQVTDAIFTRVQAAYNWSRAEKTARIWSNIAPIDQPYAGLIVPKQQADQQQAYGLTRWNLSYMLMIYVRRPGKESADDAANFQDTIDDILDAVDKSMLGIFPGEPNTLGGLVANCYIDGEIAIDPGILDQQVVIIVPITIVTGI